ncbi:MAG TPA: hypothetical protein VFA46_01635 [Actinomycetes bacterium]|nr:hypothetical protein [Actinomycetes bacterium]
MAVVAEPVGGQVRSVVAVAWKVDLVQGPQRAVQERLAAKRRPAEPDVAVADGAVEGDRVRPFVWGAVAELAPTVVGAERARYCESAMTMLGGCIR